MKPERIQLTARVANAARSFAARVYAALAWIENAAGALKAFVRSRIGGRDS